MDTNKPSYKVGDQVGVIASYVDGKLELFGFGTYQGSSVPETDEVMLWGAPLKELGIESPCILLENGEKLYGCECWWGPTEFVQKYIDAAKEVVNITPAEYRKKVKEMFEGKS